MKVISILLMLVTQSAVAHQLDFLIRDVPKIMAEIDQSQLFANIDFQENPNLAVPVLAVAVGRSMKAQIQINREKYNALNEYGKAFELMYELGRIHIAHIYYATPHPVAAQMWDQEATTFASLAMDKFFPSIDQGRTDFFEMLRKTSGAQRHIYCEALLAVGAH